MRLLKLQWHGSIAARAAILFLANKKYKKFFADKKAITTLETAPTLMISTDFIRTLDVHFQIDSSSKSDISTVK